MNRKKIVFVSADNWEGMYINGELVDEAHSLTVEDVLERLGIQFDALYANDEWLHSRGSLPRNLEDVKLEER